MSTQTERPERDRLALLLIAEASNLEEQWLPGGPGDMGGMMHTLAKDFRAIAAILRSPDPEGTVGRAIEGWVSAKPASGSFRKFFPLGLLDHTRRTVERATLIIHEPPISSVPAEGETTNG